MSAHGIIVNDNIVWLEVSKVFFCNLPYYNKDFCIFKRIFKTKVIRNNNIKSYVYFKLEFRRIECNRFINDRTIVWRFICRRFFFFHSWRSDITHLFPNCFVSFCVSILGVWSVSPLVSDVGSSNRESDADDVKQSKKMCLFADRPIAPLVICDSLNANCKEHCYSPALDREIRIKELIRKREKLLAEVRRSRAESQISLLWFTPRARYNLWSLLFALKLKWCIKVGMR